MSYTPFVARSFPSSSLCIDTPRPTARGYADTFFTSFTFIRSLAALYSANLYPGAHSLDSIDHFRSRDSCLTFAPLLACLERIILSLLRPNHLRRSPPRSVIMRFVEPALVPCSPPLALIELLRPTQFDELRLRRPGLEGPEMTRGRLSKSLYTDLLSRMA